MSSLALAAALGFGGCGAAPEITGPDELGADLNQAVIYVPPVPEGRQAVEVQWVRTRGRSFRGAETSDALVTIVGFGDFACPDTRRGEAVVADILGRHPEVRYAYVDHDVTKNRYGEFARRVAAHAAKQRQFWTAYDALFRDLFRTRVAGQEAETLTALQIGGRYRDFAAGENANAYDIIHDREAKGLGVEWAPTYFVNGVPIVDANPEDFDRLVREQLAAARRVHAETGVAGEDLYLTMVHRNGGNPPGVVTPGTWHWVGVEVVGHSRTDRETLVSQLPIELGAVANTADIDADWCARRAEELDLARLDCSSLRYSDFGAYLTMHVVEEGDEARMATRPAPTAEAPTIPDELATKYAELEAAQTRLFQIGEPAMENSDKGWLEFDNPELQKLVAELLELAPPHRETLLEIVANHRDMRQRAVAARLLNWAGEVHTSIASVHTLTDDPSPLVRNDISRFMLHYVAGLEDAAVRQAVADSALRQVRRPTMPDQNKALFVLLELAQSSPTDAAYIVDAGGPWLEQLAKQSALQNVGDVADRLLKLKR